MTDPDAPAEPNAPAGADVPPTVPPTVPSTAPPTVPSTAPPTVPSTAPPTVPLPGREPVDHPAADSGADTDPRGVPVTAPPPRRRVPRRSQVLAAALLGLLGFSVVIQARQTQEDGLSSLRQNELVRVFDNLQQESARLEAESRELQRTQADLRSGTDNRAAAERAARKRLETLGILAGTLPATGPGIRLDIDDPDSRVSAAMLLDTVQELRDAGAEAIQVNEVRVVANTSFVDGPDGVVAAGRELQPPFRLLAIGDGQTMASALDIPGGVLEVLRSNGARGTVTIEDALTVSALRQVSAPQYAQPAPAGGP